MAIMTEEDFNETVSAPGILSWETISSLWDHKNKQFGLEVRKLGEECLDQVKALHGVCFPVKYSDNFYNQLLNGKYVCHLVFEKKTGTLVVLGTGRVDPGTKRKGYVATLGVNENFRKNGLGILMLRHIEYLLMQQEEPPQIFELHVGDYNKGAMRMYDKAKYDCVKFLPKHYTWGGERHDAYLYQKEIPNEEGHHEEIIIADPSPREEETSCLKQHLMDDQVISSRNDSTDEESDSLRLVSERNESNDSNEIKNKIADFRRQFNLTDMFGNIKL